MLQTEGLLSTCERGAVYAEYQDTYVTPTQHTLFPANVTLFILLALAPATCARRMNNVLGRRKRMEAGRNNAPF